MRLDWLAHIPACKIESCLTTQWGYQPVFTKKARPCSKKPESSFAGYTHKACTTAHKRDIETRQKHRYNTNSVFRSIFLVRNYTVAHLFFINNMDNFWGNSKFFAMFCAPCMVIDPRRKRFVMNMQLTQRFARAKLIRLKISQIFRLFYFQRSQRCEKKSEFQNMASKKPNWQPCCTRIENVHKVHKKTFNFLLCIDVQKT